MFVTDTRGLNIPEPGSADPFVLFKYQQRSFAQRRMYAPHSRPLPAGNGLSLYVDDVPADGADEAQRLILALRPTNGR